jgi:hypothetical protein
MSRGQLDDYERHGKRRRRRRAGHKSEWPKVCQKIVHLAWPFLIKI